MPWEDITTIATTITAIASAITALYKLGQQLGLWRALRQITRHLCRSPRRQS